MSALSSQDKSTDEIRYFITILRNPGPVTPLLEYGPKAKTAVEKLAENFRTNTSTEQHNLPPPS